MSRRLWPRPKPSGPKGVSWVPIAWGHFPGCLLSPVSEPRHNQRDSESMAQGDRGPHQGVGKVLEINLFMHSQLSIAPINQCHKGPRPECHAPMKPVTSFP